MLSSSNDRCARQPLRVRHAHDRRRGLARFLESFARRAGHDGELPDRPCADRVRSSTTPIPPKAAACCSGASRERIRPAGSTVLRRSRCAYPSVHPEQRLTRSRTGRRGSGPLARDRFVRRTSSTGVAPARLRSSFDGSAAARQHAAVTCNYTGLDLQERTCSPNSCSCRCPRPVSRTWLAAARAALRSARAPTNVKVVRPNESDFARRAAGKAVESPRRRGPEMRARHTFLLGKRDPADGASGPLIFAAAVACWPLLPHRRARARTSIRSRGPGATAYLRDRERPARTTSTSNGEHGRRAASLLNGASEITIVPLGDAGG
jgi:hypothetical protein